MASIEQPGDRRRGSLRLVKDAGPRPALICGTEHTEGRGVEAIDSVAGMYCYESHNPLYTVLYTPRKEPEELRYIVPGNELTVRGWKLRACYEALKEDVPGVLSESTGPYDPNSKEPYIRTIAHRFC